MELSRQADYAVRAMVDIAAFPAGARVATGAIGRRQQIPGNFLPHIIGELKRAGLVRAYRGNAGGISLARPASAISVLDVVQAIEGPVSLNRCTSAPSRCDRCTFCPVHPVWRRAQEALNQILAGASIADLASGTPFLIS